MGDWADSRDLGASTNIPVYINPANNETVNVKMGACEVSGHGQKNV